MDGRTDEVLMTAYRDTREPEALVELFRRHRAPLFRFLLRRTGNPARSEDLVQEVFAALMDGAGRYRPTGSWRAYVYRIASNLSSKEWRWAKRAVELTAEPVSGAAGAAETSLDERRAAEAVRVALAGIEADQREAILLREYQDLSYEEIAAVLGVPTGTVKSRIARGKLALRRALRLGA